MAADLPQLIPSSTAKVIYQDTSFGIDALSRNVCNTWDEALTNPNFDAVVIGGGMFGGYCADKLYRNTQNKRLRTLVLEAGTFLVPEHVQDLPNIGLNVPQEMDPFSDNGLPRELVWGMPWRGNVPFIGTAYCVGGKSAYWGGWCPRLTDEDLGAWPAGAAQYLKANYALVEDQLGVSKPTEFIQGALYDALRAKASTVLPSVNNLVEVQPPPLAVLGQGPASGLFTFDKYSSTPLLISAIRDAIGEAGFDDARRRLFVVPKAHVVKLHPNAGTVDQIEVFVDGQQRFLSVSPQCAVILAAGAIESTRLALESFPTTGDPATELMGRNLMVHMRSNTTVRIKRAALQTGGQPLPALLQTAALLVRGKTNDGHFHLQVTAADDPGGNSDALLFQMIPDIDLVNQILHAQTADSVTITLRGCAETKGIKDQPIHNPAQRWMDLSPFDRDEFGFRRAYVNLAISGTEAQLWDAMDAATNALARKLANDDASAIDFVSFNRDGLGTTYHEAGTLWMGDDPAASVTNADGRFHHVTNAYCIDQALFTTVGSVNPTLTGLTLARKVAEHLTG